MADNAGRVANMARILAIGHIIVGSLLICFGIADRAMQNSDTGYVGYGIWIGVWVSCACVYFNAAHAIFIQFEKYLIFRLKRGGFSI